MTGAPIGARLANRRRMTQPRCIRPGRTTTVTRRTTRRHFLLRPDPDGRAQQIYWYTTAVMAAKFGILLHAVQVLSTHMHEVLTDPNGVLPNFVRERNRLLANALKVHRGWPEEVFQRAPASYVELYGPDAVLKQIGYTLANCVEAGLVDHPDQWPGVTVSVDDIGSKVIEVERPPVYFDPENPQWPERVTLRIEMPQVLEEAYGPNALEMLRLAVAEAVGRARSIARQAGHRISTSAARLMAVPFARRARSFEPFGKRNPTFATGGNPTWRRVALDERRVFRQLYRRALDAVRKGVEHIPFPAGTWRWARELLSLRMAAPAAT
jgi:putative transposase